MTMREKDEERKPEALRKDREERLAAALRENLRKRKAQARARSAEAPPTGGGDRSKP